MKKLATVAAALLVGFASFAGNPEKETTYTVNAEKTVIKWIGKKVTGEHYGKIAVKEGHFNVADDKVSGKVWTDMNNITCDDMEAGEWNEKLIGHLKSEDFFNVEKFPTAEFIFKKFEDGIVTGDLTIKGITQEISFPAEVKYGKTTFALKGKLTFDRTLYKIEYGSGKFFEGLGDKMIYDDVELEFALIATK